MKDTPTAVTARSLRPVQDRPFIGLGKAASLGRTVLRPGAGSLGGTANAEERWEGAQATVSLLLRQEADPPKLPVLESLLC
ncbi:unnamed protein product [Calypogeia fissa]